MGNFLIGAREFEAPVFVPSVSSYETQISPSQGLLIQDAISEPISLASAFDVRRFGSEVSNALVQFRKGHGILLLDSGGYESSHYDRFSAAAHQQSSWSFKQFISTMHGIEYDLAFSFDVFPKNDQSPVEYVSSLISMLSEHNSIIPNDKIIPVVHLFSESGTLVFDNPRSVEVIKQIHDEWEPTFIAIPERELGVGIIDRAVHARKLVRALGKSQCKLHALGCGNPLSIALLSVAGISMMDGLEWCRTVVAPENSHLHHFQQLYLFEATLNNFDPTASMLYDLSTNYNLRTVLQNLVLFREFMTNLRSAMRRDKVHDFLTSLYGAGVNRALEAINAA